MSSSARTKLGRFAAALCVLATTAAAAAELERVRIGLAREASSGPLYIAAAEGYFKSEGLDAQLVFFPSDAAVRAAAASGVVEVGAAALTAAFYRDAAAHGLKIFASQVSDQTGFPMYTLVIGRRAHDAGFAGVRELPGRRIGMTDPDAGVRYALYSVGTRFGIDSATIKLVWLQTPGRELEALAQGEIDAAVVPFATAVQSARKGDVLIHLSNFALWQEGVVFARAQELADKRSTVTKFMRAYRRGTAEYHLNFLHYDDGGDFIQGPRYTEYLKLIAAEARVPPDVLAVTKTYCDPLAMLNVADISNQVKFWQRTGRLDTQRSASDFLDLSFTGLAQEAASGLPAR